MYSVRMPNKWNFSFDYFYAAIIVLAIYLPGKVTQKNCGSRPVKYLQNIESISCRKSFECISLLTASKFYLPNEQIFFRNSTLVWLHAWTKKENSFKIEKAVTFEDRQTVD